MLQIYISPVWLVLTVLFLHSLFLPLSINSMVSETSGRGEGDESVSVLETVPSTPVGSVEPSLPAAGVQCC